MVKIMENPILKWDDFGIFWEYPYFWKHPCFFDGTNDGTMKGK